MPLLKAERKGFRWLVHWVTIRVPSPVRVPVLPPDSALCFPEAMEGFSTSSGSGQRRLLSPQLFSSPLVSFLSREVALARKSPHQGELQPPQRHVLGLRFRIPGEPPEAAASRRPHLAEAWGGRGWRGGAGGLVRRSVSLEAGREASAVCSGRLPGPAEHGAGAGRRRTPLGLASRLSLCPRGTHRAQLSLGFLTRRACHRGASGRRTEPAGTDVTCLAQRQAPVSA